jgi:hypothetical protein
MALSLVSTKSAFAQGNEIQQLLLNWEKFRQLEETGQMYQGYKSWTRVCRIIKDIAQRIIPSIRLFLKFDGSQSINMELQNAHFISSSISFGFPAL